MVQATPKTITLELATGFRCGSCEKFSTDPAEFPPLWECSNDNCGETYVSDDRACPSCNRTFSRKNADHACPDCNEEAEEETVAICPSCNEPLKCDGCDEVVK